jgi:hypothetical protein
MAAKLSALRTGHTFLPRNIFFNVSGIHFCYRLSKPQGLVRQEGLGKFKISPHRVSNPRQILQICFYFRKKEVSPPILEIHRNIAQYERCRAELSRSLTYGQDIYYFPLWFRGRPLDRYACRISRKNCLSYPAVTYKLKERLRRYTY